jgi:hypothetical protein
MEITLTAGIFVTLISWAILAWRRRGTGGLKPNCTFLWSLLHSVAYSYWDVFSWELFMTSLKGRGTYLSAFHLLVFTVVMHRASSSGWVWCLSPRE